MVMTKNTLLKLAATFAKWAEFHLQVMQESEGHHPSEEHCARCGGKCCKFMPGATHPEQFGAPNKQVLVQNIFHALTTGQWTVDWWEGDPAPDERYMGKCMYLRPAIVGREHELEHPAWGGEAECTFLGQEGCGLEPGHRPEECRSLRVGEGGQCGEKDFGKKESAIAWRPYQNEIHEAINMVRRKAA
jgi:hypothetical protein